MGREHQGVQAWFGQPPVPAVTQGPIQGAASASVLILGRGEGGHPWSVPATAGHGRRMLTRSTARELAQGMQSACAEVKTPGCHRQSPGRSGCYGCTPSLTPQQELLADSGGREREKTLRRGGALCHAACSIPNTPRTFSQFSRRQGSWQLPPSRAFSSSPPLASSAPASAAALPSPTVRLPRCRAEGM